MSFDERWPRMTLRQAGVSLIDCDHRTPPAAEQGYPYIAIPQLKDGHVDLTGVRRISAADYAEWTKKLKPRANDVIVVRRCNSGESALIPPGLECAIGQNLVVLRSDGSAVERRFLRWLVRGPDWWDQVGKYINVGAVFDSLRCRDIPSFELTVPPRAEQASIVGMLDALDDRIALLRETNATLEAIAHALFKSWFVDFDPVRAKQQGLAPVGLDEATATCFPDSFEESTRGSIPCGWPIAPFADTVNVVGGGTPRTSVPEYWGGDIPWFSVVDAPNGSDTFVVATEKSITAVGLQNCASKLLPVGATIISARGTVGRLAVVGREMAMNQSCYGLRGKTGDFYFTYFTTRGLVDSLKQRSHGSVFDTITRETLASVSVVVPPTALVNRFEATVAPVMQRIRENQLQAQSLATLRDTLLPRLISGQLCLPEVEARMDEALV